MDIDEAIRLGELPSLDHSRPLDVWKRTEKPAALRAAKEITNLLQRKSDPVMGGEASGEVLLENKLPKKVTKLFENHLKRVLWDLVVSGYGPTGERLPESAVPWIAVKLRNEGNGTFGLSTRYNRLGFKVRSLRSVLDSLEARSLIYRKRGFFDRRKAQSGKITRIRGTAALWQILDGLSPDDFERDPAEESLVFKDAEGTLMDYKDSAVTRHFRANLNRINDKLMATRVTLPLDEDLIEEIERQRRENKKRAGEPYRAFAWSTVNLSKVTLKRQFKINWMLGGRFYGPWWQNIPSQARRHLKIDDWPTVEIDFSSLHPVIAYVTSKVPLEADPYTLPGFEGHRGAVKVVFQTVLNSSSPSDARSAAVYDKKKRIQRPAWYADLVTPIMEHHRAIAGKLCRQDEIQPGAKMQNMDSEIAETVMLHMLDQHDQACLPVHDSFIVRADHEHVLLKAMAKAFVKRFPAAEDFVRIPLFKSVSSDGTISRHTLQGVLNDTLPF